MSSDELRASPAIKRKVDGIISDDEEAIAVLDQNIKKSKTDQDEPGTASETSQDKNISDVPPQLSINVPKISDLRVSSKRWNDVQLPLDILLLTVKDYEFLASYSYLENPFKSYCQELGHVYFGKIGQLNVALLRCQEGSSTPGGATIVAKNAITKMKPKAVFSVGVCSALSPTKANLGDVVISSNLATYAHKIVTTEGSQPCGIRTPVSRDLSYVIKHATEGWKAPLQDPDAREVKLHCDGVILSGPEIVNARQRCEELIQLHPDATAIETEGEGLFAAAFDLKMEWVIVKAIADYADGTTTSESWRTVAGVMAASVVANILSDATVFQTWPHYQDTKPSLPRSCLDPMVPNFTGRQKECEEIIGHVTSESTRIVSIWGSPGFGKTSVAIAVGHHLHSQGLPVYCLSLRGLQSKADLTSKLLSLFRKPATNDQPPQHLSLDDELFQLFSKISDRSVLILDNADELLESGMPKMKEDFIDFLHEIFRRTEKVALVITTRESLEYMNVQFQGNHAVRIRPLDESSSQDLVHGLLPSATSSESIKIAKICGHVPLAIKLLCSSISEDDAQPSQFLDDFMGSNILEVLDNPDYPSNLRLKLLFDSSFQRLSVKEKEAIVSLSILPDSFDLTVAAAVLGISQIFQAKKLLHSLRRKSLLDSSSKPKPFLTHKLLQSFAREKGEQEMKGTLVNSKARLNAFYVSRFEKLNEQFLTGYSMSAFIDFYEDEQGIVQSLMGGCSDSKTANSVFEVLVKADLFLYSLYCCQGDTFDEIYHSAIEAAKQDGKNLSVYRQLLVSLAFGEVTWGAKGRTMQRLSEAKDISEASCSAVSVGDKGKHLCYMGIYKLVLGKTEDGVQCLHEALSLMMNSTPEQKILRIVAFQILAIYFRFKKNSSSMSQFYSKAVQECRAAGDTQLLVIPAMESTGKKDDQEEMSQRNSGNLINQPLKLQIIFIVSEAGRNISDTETKQSVSNATLNIAKEIEKPIIPSSVGLFHFQGNVTAILRSVSSKLEDAAKLSAARISYHESELKQYKSRKENFPNSEGNSTISPALHQEALATWQGMRDI